MVRLQVLILTTLFALLTACALNATPAPATGGSADVAAPTVEATTGGNSSAALRDEKALQNLEYTIASLDGKVVTLTDGVYENADEHTFISYIRTEAYADVTGDGQEDALVHIGSTYGAGGMFTDLAVVSVDESGALKNVATVMLGDRVTVEKVTVENGQIVVDMVTQGSNEPMCCGTMRVTATYAMEAGALQEVARVENGYLYGVENFFNPETFNNITVRSSVVPSGTMTLTDGEFEDVAAKVHVTVDTHMIQFADLTNDQKPEAILLLHSNTGGSGMFTELVVATAAEGKVFDLATTLLGDRVTVYSIIVTDTNTIVVDMLTQGAEDPMCCPTSHVEATYSLEGETLEQVSLTEIGTIPAQGSSGLTPEGVTFDYEGFAESVEGTLIPYLPPLDGPAMAGLPEHLLFAFDGETIESLSPFYTQLRVFPVEQYKAMYEVEGIEHIDNYFAELEAQLESGSTEIPLDMSDPLPFPPVFAAAQDLATNVEYVDFEGGRGFRFITHYAQAVDPYLSGQIFYGYQGLTDDGKYMVLFLTPLHTELLPETYDEIPQELLESLWDGTGFDDYRVEINTLLNEASPDQFTPNLETLDGMMQSLTITAQQ